jgi:hypothetical protein
LPTFVLKFTDEATAQLAQLEKDSSLEKRLKAVRKTLGRMETNLRHPSLSTHEYKSLTKLMGEKVFESYAESNTPAAYRIFWKYGPGKNTITIISITSHP